MYWFLAEDARLCKIRESLCASWRLSGNSATNLGFYLTPVFCAASNATLTQELGSPPHLLSPEERDEWFGWIDAGPDSQDVDRSLENRGRGGSEEDRQKWIHDWQFEKLHWVQAHLKGQRREFYDKLLAQRGEPSSSLAGVAPNRVGWRGRRAWPTTWWSCISKSPTATA